MWPRLMVAAFPIGRVASRVALRPFEVQAGATTTDFSGRKKGVLVQQ
jgi:hypothetical protein